MRGDQTIHIFSHFIRRKEVAIRNYLRASLLSRLDYFHHVSEKYLEKCQISYEDYIDCISTPGVAVDLLGIFLIARLYRFHVGVVFKNGVWHTNWDNDINKTMFVLVFRGDTFSKMCKLNKSDLYLQSLVAKTDAGLMPLHCPDVKISLLDSAEKDPKLSMKPKVIVKPVKSAQQSVATKLLDKAKRDLCSTVEKTEKQQLITELIHSGQAGGNKMISVDCTLCNIICRSTREYVWHMREYHPEATFTCDICGKVYQSFNGRYKHMKVHSGNKVVCIVCGRGFNFTTELKNHLPVHDTASKHYCTECGKGFASKSSLR